MIKLIKISIILILINSCSKSDKILSINNFDKGSWMLVHENYMSDSLEIIDDETILKRNKNGLILLPGSDCQSTTCDGSLKLYRDGKLILEQGYLTRSLLYESNEIKKSYSKAAQWTIDPIDKIDFNKKWDSLIKVKCYPTIYHTQPDDKDIIWVYKTKS